MTPMLLPQTAEYAMRAMACFAAQTQGRALRARDLTEITGIPTPYLSKILRRMVVEGLLVSQKGHHGGFMLARPPNEIRFIDIFKATAFEPAPNRCAFGWGACDESAPCPLHPAYRELKDAFHEWAARTTLADVDLDAISVLLPFPVS